KEECKGGMQRRNAKEEVPKTSPFANSAACKELSCHVWYTGRPLIGVTSQPIKRLSLSRIYLGPYGSPRSHERYQETLGKWKKHRHEEAKADAGEELLPVSSASSAKPVITAAKLRTKRLLGQPITVNEVIYVYRLHTFSYYQKHGEVTREAGVIDDALRILRKHFGDAQASEFCPVALDELRERMIEELDWSRKYLNKQVSRIRSMFKWASAKEIVDAAIPAALRELAGLKRGRTKARETRRIRVVDDSIVEMTLPKLPETVADMVRIQRLTSARPGEICSMAPADIDCTSDVWIYRPVEFKTEHFEKDRFIAIGPRAQQILKKYLNNRDAEAFCFSPSESEARRRAIAAKLRKTPLSWLGRPGPDELAFH
ncbi:MAG: site-specific integrase, partial [Pirellulales bacterium]